jgi:uncharacterized protein YndB with AHSA1/START domain
MPDPAVAAATSDSVLRLSRTFRAARERVFGAFTDVKQLKQWWGPKGFSLPEAELDARPGGRYRLHMLSPEGNSYVLSGAFVELRPPERMVYTWVWEQGDNAGVEMLVTLEFRDLGGATELIVTHERLPSVAARDAHAGGWSSSLDRLEERFAHG